ncbi:MAG: hypothetical protein AAB385_09120, partial [Planctomycetota bacterium]
MTGSLTKETSRISREAAEGAVGEHDVPTVGAEKVQVLGVLLLDGSVALSANASWAVPANAASGMGDDSIAHHALASGLVGEGDIGTKIIHLVALGPDEMAELLREGT